MSLHLSWRRALDRYADSVYRLALLSEPTPAWAAKATSHAFTALDWDNVAPDERLEGRLVAALPAPPRRFRRPNLAPLPPAFWRLPYAARIALGLRLTRGYAAPAIAEALGRPVEQVRDLLLNSIARLAGDEVGSLPDICRKSRLERLDEPGADRAHVRSCEDCRATAERWERTEQALAAAIGAATGRLTLPRRTVDALALKLGAPADEARAGWRQAWLLSGAVVLAVSLVIVALVLPRGRSAAETGAVPTPRELLQRAVDQYGAVPAGVGIVHRRYRFDLWSPDEAREAETWTDASQPARHRMQIWNGKQVQEWQAADGEESLRYVSASAEQCGPYYERSALGLDMIHTWRMPPAEQAALRETRWRYGPWAAGRRYLQRGLAAERLRSLGVVQEGEAAVVTLSAEGAAIEGTLLLKLDARTGDLREVREITSDNGTTRARVPWRLLSEERLEPEAAKQVGIFRSVPLDPRPRELERAAPLVDPACPVLGDQRVASPIEIIGRGWPSIIGFGTPPTGTQQILLVGPERGRGSLGEPEAGDDSTLVYVGDGKRLQISASYNNDASRIENGTPAGDWRVFVRPLLIGQYEGFAETPSSETGTSTPRFTFRAEGWSRDELLPLLGTARLLTLPDAIAQRAALYDPNPPSAAMLDLITPALDAATPLPSEVWHVIAERTIRRQPGTADLRDPYHAPPPGGATETWAEYGADGKVARFRVESRLTDGSLGWAQWGDGERSQAYDARTKMIHEYEGVDDGQFVGAQLTGAIARIFQYRQYAVTEIDPKTATLHATVPISETELRWAVQEQRGNAAGNATGWPWLADLDARLVRYQTTFDRASGRLVRSEVYVEGSHGSTLVERIELKVAETLPNVPDEVWNVALPSNAVRADTNRAPSGGWRGGRVHSTNLEDVAATAPAPLWGWKDNGRTRFRTAITSARGITADSAQTLDFAIDAGAAVELRYDMGPGTELRLLQGPAAALRTMLRQTPARWTASDRRDLRVAGVEREVWLMRNTQTGQRWAIFQIDETLIVMAYTSDQIDDAILPFLDLLAPLP